ncbi:hypothetical protein GAYE_SCF40G5372 [Galdieria yellowstonensis]|uniref:SAM domain-containing protein n=1 Tax=Galdieria yellowstonensis TaxID=3028027 RepID=A0AAV9IJC5_9RHOD|nr:hypothetical protein GAYE_SCF40G5372 [Galdieria yellowstonensis]
MYIYSVGVPMYLVHVLRELVDLRKTGKNTDLSDNDMEALIDSIPMNTSVLIIPAHMSPETMNVFCSMLLAAVLELRIKQDSFVTINGPEEKEFIKLICPKFALKFVKLSYEKHPPIRFLHSIFSLIRPKDSPSTRGYKLQVLFSFILYVRLSFCKHLGELSIFFQSLVEEIRKGAFEYICRVVTSFDPRVVGDHSSGEKSYSTSAWKKFFDKYLSKDGMFLPNRQNSSGPDVILRVSTPIEGFSSAFKEGESSQKQVFIEETSLNKKRIYLIGMALKYYNPSGPGVDLAMIKQEFAKFLEPVASQLELKENNNITAIQLVVSNKYHDSVLKHFTDHQNLVLNSGVYYEDDDGKLTCNLSDFSSYSKKKWLELPVNCQVVICSPQNLNDCFGLNDMLKKSFEELWTDMPYEAPPGYLGLCTELDMFSAENMKQTKRKGVKTDSSVGSVRRSEFDWMEFVKTYCKLTESEASEYLYTLGGFSESEMEVVDTSMLKELGIDDSLKRLKIVTGMASYARKKRPS